MNLGKLLSEKTAANMGLCSLKAILNESTITTVCKVIGGLPDDGLTGEQSFADIYKNYHEWTII